MNSSFFTDEVWCKNSSIWSGENSNAYHEKLLNVQKIGVMWNIMGKKLSVLFSFSTPFMQNNMTIFYCNSLEYWKRKIDTASYKMTVQQHTVNIQLLILLRNTLVIPSFVMVAYGHRIMGGGGLCQRKTHSNKPWTVQQLKWMLILNKIY